MSLGTILLMFLITLVVSVVRLWPRDQSCLYLEKVKRRRSWVMFLVNKRFLTVFMWAFVLLLTSCQQEGTQLEKPGETISNKGESVAGVLDDFTLIALNDCDRLDAGLRFQIQPSSAIRCLEDVLSDAIPN